jgi:hypothetical protein
VLAFAQSSFISPGSAIPSSDGSGASSSLAGDPLVISGSPVEGEEMQAEREEGLDSPAAVDARHLSRTRFENLNTAGAVQVAREEFPEVVDRLGGGPPKLPSGDRIISYVGSDAAAVALPGGKHGVIESLEPIAMPSGNGHFTPIDLTLHAGADGYVPTNSDVAVDLPKQMAVAWRCLVMGCR